MSKNTAIGFVVGLLTGAAGGSVATYYIYKRFRDEDEEIREEDMRIYYEEREKRKLEEKGKVKSEKLPEETNDQNSTVSEDREKINSNEGVKKYHHDNGLESAYGSARIFGEDAKPIKKKESKLINEISEQEFLNNENGYQKQTVDIFMSDDDETPEIFGIWAYETDNEEPVDKRFGKTTSELIGNRTYDELASYCDDEEGLGQLYLKNDELKIDFEFIIHLDKEEVSE